MSEQKDSLTEFGACPKCGKPVKRKDAIHCSRQCAGNTKHCLTYSSEWQSWRKMRARCISQTDKDYPHYGARGIKVCERWNSFENFLKDMGPRPRGCASNQHAAWTCPQFSGCFSRTRRGWFARPGQRRGWDTRSGGPNARPRKFGRPANPGNHRTGNHEPFEHSPCTTTRGRVMTTLPPDCYSCKHAGCDPDGPYCGHPESFKQTMFGRGLNMMRNDIAHPQTAVCGLEGKLFEPKEG